MIFALHNPDILPASSPTMLYNMVRELHGSTIFFVLSGFLITNYIQTRALATATDYVKFILTRLFRLYPLYWCILLVLHLQWLFFIPELLLHITLLKGYFAKVSLAGIVQAWSLTVEITFYLLTPFIFRLIKTRSLFAIYLIILFAGVILTLAGLLLNHYGFNPYGFMADFNFFLITTFFGRATDFFAGIFLFYKIKNNQPISNIKGLRLSYTYLGIALFLVIIFVISLCGEKGDVGLKSWPGLLINNFILPWPVILFIYGLINEQTLISKLLSSKPVSLLGNASYAFFLIHLGWVKNYVYINITPSLVANFFLLWFISILLYLFFEKPLYKLAKRKIMALSRRTTA